MSDCSTREFDRITVTTLASKCCTTELTCAYGTNPTNSMRGSEVSFLTHSRT